MFKIRRQDQPLKNKSANVGLIAGYSLTFFTWILSELQAAHVLRQAVGFGTRHSGAGGHRSGRPLPWHLHCGPQQVDLLTVDILHVVLPDGGDRGVRH